jgi:hypothetical protein
MIWQGLFFLWWRGSAVLKISIVGPVFIWSVPLVTSQSLLYGGRHYGGHRYSNTPWVGVHASWFNVLQLISGFYPPYLKQVLEVFSFGLETRSAPNKHVVRFTSKFCCWNWRGFLGHLQCEDKNRTGLHLACYSVTRKTLWRAHSTAVWVDAPSYCSKPYGLLKLHRWTKMVLEYIKKSHEIIGPVILVALIAHHTPVITPSNCISWVFSRPVATGVSSELKLRPTIMRDYDRRASRV